MNSRIIIACLLLLGTIASAQDSEANRWQETGAHVIKLPVLLPGLVAYPVCDVCTTRQYSIDSKTELRIGDSVVTLDQLRAEIAARPEALALVVISPDWRSIQTIAIVPRRPGK